ncbi:kinesin-related protein 12-like [Zerene cesonia]|uniref:kinesin-related protein 12-like n=1 Tax=Zerene cesonia TaxID=33412 RepID=UPI0018E55736|nr:kinesin-related protein 12-like [Zerene cesonia]XP_038213428.1 kinesin-related protein 12-like [Zerene cesonia]
MFKFRGFRASLDFLTGKQRRENLATSPISIGGAYKVNREEYGGNVHIHRAPKKIHPSMVQLPHSRAKQTEKSKSTSDLVEPTTILQQASRSSYDVSQNSRASKRLAKEQKKLERQRLAEQKKQEKIAAKERHKQEKLEQERIKRGNKMGHSREPCERTIPRKKRNAPLPPQNQSINDTQGSSNRNQTNDNNRTHDIPRSNATNIQRQSYSTNTLESSISRTTGPPPYGEYPEIIIDDDNTGNITFGRPVDYNSSWNLISQHREEMRKPAASAPIPPRRKKDLQYRVGNLQVGTSGENNSEA